MEYITGVITLQAIFSLYWEGYLAWFKGTIRPAVHENVRKILMCRTPQLGFHAFKCPNCNNIKLMPHSCKSRFCSSCGKVATDKWVEERLTDILDVEYHHLVFTLPWQLRAICLLNREIMFNLLFKAVSESIISWSKKYGGYIPGFYIVLHTFGSDLKFNQHFHVLITAGGISLNRKKWIAAPKDFLMPEKGLKKRWKYNVIKGIIKANNNGLLEMPFLPKKQEYINLRGVISVISKLCWYVYIGARLIEVGLSVRYIGRYTKRPVIAETRIIKCTERWVIFKFKDYADGGKMQVKRMGLYTFITYLTQHIPDKDFRNVRGYGIFSNRLKGDLIPQIRKLLRKKNKQRKVKKEWRERLNDYTGHDPLCCDNCGCEMILFYVCYGPEKGILKKLGLCEWERMPIKQFQIQD